MKRYKSFGETGRVEHYGNTTPIEQVYTEDVPISQQRPTSQYEQYMHHHSSQPPPSPSVPSHVPNNNLQPPPHSTTQNNVVVPPYYQQHYPLQHYPPTMNNMYHQPHMTNNFPVPPSHQHQYPSQQYINYGHPYTPVETFVPERPKNRNMYMSNRNMEVTNDKRPDNTQKTAPPSKHQCDLVYKHIMNCPDCSKRYKNDINFYITIIVILILFIMFLMTKVIDKICN